MKQLTPVLVVDSIEKCLPFWIDRLGFQKTVEVPELREPTNGDGDDDSPLGFVALVKGPVEVMLQTRTSLSNDIPALADAIASTLLYVEVENLGAIEPAIDGLDAVFRRRQTFYGAIETCVRDPSGNAVIFAEFPKE